MIKKYTIMLMMFGAAACAPEDINLLLEQTVQVSQLCETIAEESQANRAIVKRTLSAMPYAHVTPITIDGQLSGSETINRFMDRSYLWGFSRSVFERFAIEGGKTLYFEDAMPCAHLDRLYSQRLCQQVLPSRFLRLSHSSGAEECPKDDEGRIIADRNLCVLLDADHAELHGQKIESIRDVTADHEQVFILSSVPIEEAIQYTYTSQWIDSGIPDVSVLRYDFYFRNSAEAISFYHVRDAGGRSRCGTEQFSPSDLKNYLQG